MLESKYVGSSALKSAGSVSGREYWKGSRPHLYGRKRLSQYAAGAIAGLLMSSSLVGSAVVGDRPESSPPAVDLSLADFPGGCDEGQGAGCGNAAARGDGANGQYISVGFMAETDYFRGVYSAPGGAFTDTGARQGHASGSGYAGGGQNSSGGGVGGGGGIGGGLGSGLSYYWPQSSSTPNYLPGAGGGSGSATKSSKTSCEAKDEKNKSKADDTSNNKGPNKDAAEESCKESTASESGPSFAGYSQSAQFGAVVPGLGFTTSSDHGENAGIDDGNGNGNGGGIGSRSTIETQATVVIAAVPEPSALALIGWGLFLIGFGAWRSGSRSAPVKA